MNQHLQPFVQGQVTAANQGNAQQMGQQLVQVLGLIAQTQQEILNRLQTQQSVQSSGTPIAPAYPTCSAPSGQYIWLYNYGLAYNFDGTRKVQQLTPEDIAQHRKLLADFASLYGIK